MEYTFWDHVQHWWWTNISNCIWAVERRLRRVYCWFKSHDIGWGERVDHYQLEPDYCKRCWYDEDEIDIHDGDAWHWMNRRFVWAYDHISAIEPLMIWIDERQLWNHLPSWMEY